MTSPEGYKPSEEEVKQAEDMMTPRQEAQSEVREEIYKQLSEADQETIKGSNLMLVDETRLGGSRSISGEVKNYDILLSYSKDKYSGKVDGLPVSPSQAEQLFQRYINFAVLGDIPEDEIKRREHQNKIKDLL